MKMETVHGKGIHISERPTILKDILMMAVYVYDKIYKLFCTCKRDVMRIFITCVVLTLVNDA